LSSGWKNNGGSTYSSAPTFANAPEHSFTFDTKHTDVTGLNGTDQGDVRIRFTVHDGTYDSVLPVSSTNFGVDNLNPTGTITCSDPNPSHVDVGTLTITASFSEALGEAPRITIDRPNPMSTIGPVDMSGSGSVWTYDLAIQRHNGTTAVDGVYLATITNVSDLFGNPGGETSNFTSDTRDTDGDGERDYIDSDDDNDELPDTWEAQYGLDPLDGTGANGKDGDFDNDNWTNYEEYTGGSDPGDETSYPPSSVPEIVETLPHNNAGITDTTRVPNSASFCTRVEDSHGIDVTDSQSISFTINDRINGAYTRDLGDTSVVRVVKLAEEPDTSVTKLWVVYDRSLDALGVYSFETQVTVTVDVENRKGAANQVNCDFLIETEEEHDYAQDPANLPDASPVDPGDPALGGPYDTGIQVNSGGLEGAKTIYVSTEPLLPSYGPSDEIPPISRSHGAPVNLQPLTVFNTPVKIFVPYPSSKKVSQLAIYVHKGGEWVRACDNKGRVRPGGEGWMVPGSRVDHDEANPPTIELKAYHFSAVQAADDPGDPGFSSLTGAEMGGGCFISTLSRD
jgi:hypothetical protein